LKREKKKHALVLDKRITEGKTFSSPSNILALKAKTKGTKRSEEEEKAED
jgi:hypothetical protein